MTFLNRVRILWLGFWSNLIGGSESRHKGLVAQGSLQSYKQHLGKLRDAMTNLIYQKKRMQDQLKVLQTEIYELKADIEEAVRSDADELAINLIAKVETVEEEYNFIKTQLAAVNKDIKVARETEAQLQKEISQQEQIMGSLTSRYASLKVRRELQAELQNASSVVSDSMAKVKIPIADHIRRLEAEMEVIQGKHQSWESDWQKIRSKRSESRHEEALRKIKENLRPRKLPAVQVAEVAEAL